MLRKLLKSAFPAPLLRRWVRLYNTFKIKTFDRLFFPAHVVPEEDLFFRRTDQPFRLDTSKITDERVRNYMNRCGDWMREEYILLFRRPCIIEPLQGWAFYGKKLIYESLGSSGAWHVRRPRPRSILRKAPLVHLGKAISLRDPGELNYFHFYNDVLTKLYFLRDSGIDLSEYKILICRSLWQKQYFSYFLSRSDFLRSLEWHVQGEEYIHVAEAIFCRPMTHTKRFFDQLLEDARLSSFEPTGRRSIFLTRSPRRGRLPENISEILEIASDLGFEIVDSDELSVAEQITLFRNTRNLVGIHGAGLTNMIYRDGFPMSILELFPPPSGYLPFHYLLMARRYGFEYQAIIGERIRGWFAVGYHLNPERFRQNLINHLIQVQSEVRSGPNQMS